MSAFPCECRCFPRFLPFSSISQRSSMQYIQSSHFFINDATFHCPFSWHILSHANTNIDCDRNVVCVSLNSHLERICSWGARNQADFNNSKVPLPILVKHGAFILHIYFGSTVPHPSDPVSPLGLSTSSSYRPTSYFIPQLAYRVVHKVGVLFCIRHFVHSSLPSPPTQTSSPIRNWITRSPMEWGFVYTHLYT